MTTVDKRRGTLARTSGAIAVATLASRVTGFLRNAAVVWVLGLEVLGNAYTAANTLPNQVYELLIGGVLTSVLVPVLVRAHHDDADHGEAYTQRLLTLATTALLAITALAVVAAPLLIDVVVDNSTGKANPALATALAYLLLPQILFYGLSALLTAVLNTRGVFGPAAWAPVLNNVVLLATLATYALLPGKPLLSPARMSDPHLLVLGIGSTLGVVVQAIILVPALRRSGFRWHWRWGWDRRFGSFGALAAWTVAYALLAQVGVVAVSNVTTAHGGLLIYTTVWLLVQLPYGIIGFSLITAILPRMSRASAGQNTTAVIRDLSLATRLCAVVMLPSSALLTVLGPPLGIAVFSYGNGVSEAGRLGIALAFAAFGVLPYALTLIQLRVFYAMNDARTPTLIMLIMTALKVPLTYLTPHLLPSEHVIYGVVVANSLTFVIGWAIGQLWLRVRLGPLRGRQLLGTFAKSLLASLTAAGAALVVSTAMPSAWASLAVGGLVGATAALGVLFLLRTKELQVVMRRR
ncbi:murein biosynthesis integral membrane protein MurJ [Allokutzneria albata]|uniref:Putative peptidoglycan lipid II flippase n=1 Tax=Allokutzneria albata TaxID=211114 RepID=A0A1G9UJ10_ALLAB|nr:murein biosynthesis integral membrane protein MurJ [Allokutzneria albata]SDM59930.1 putative peptidoglycan lipid II flippase [Allokutzneria albata]